MNKPISFFSFTSYYLSFALEEQRDALYLRTCTRRRTVDAIERAPVPLQRRRTDDVRPLRFRCRRMSRRGGVTTSRRTFVALTVDDHPGANVRDTTRDRGRSRDRVLDRSRMRESSGRKKEREETGREKRENERARDPSTS